MPMTTHTVAPPPSHLAGRNCAGSGAAPQFPHRSSGNQTTFPPLKQRSLHSMFKMTLRLFSIIFLTTALMGVDGSMMPGGTSEEKPPTAEVQEIITSIKPQVEAELGRTVPELTLLSYKTQVVAGINYFAKVDIGEEDVVHLRVYKDLGQTVSLAGVQPGKGRTDTITYF